MYAIDRASCASVSQEGSACPLHLAVELFIVVNKMSEHESRSLGVHHTQCSIGNGSHNEGKCDQGLCFHHDAGLGCLTCYVSRPLSGQVGFQRLLLGSVA